ncbi:hypothetical protein M0804_010230 [Polistes exclamans]|nr:hypothetical protein M0804_010230 [Polistes exclamans]
MHTTTDLTFFFCFAKHAPTAPPAVRQPDRLNTVGWTEVRMRIRRRRRLVGFHGGGNGGLLPVPPPLELLLQVEVVVVEVVEVVEEEEFCMVVVVKEVFGSDGSNSDGGGGIDRTVCLALCRVCNQTPAQALRFVADV